MNRHFATPLVTLLAVVLVAGACGSAMTPPPSATLGSPSAAGSASILSTPVGGATPSPLPSPAILPQASPQPSPAPDPVARDLVTRLRRPEYTADTTAAAVEALARSGIGTYGGPTATSPAFALTGVVSPLRLLDFQVHALAVDAWAGQGLSGAAVDTLLPVPDQIHDQTAPGSAFLAGYVAAVDSPGAAVARELMAGQDLSRPDLLHFPLMVLMLFTSDLATDGGVRSASALPASSAVVLIAVGISARGRASVGSAQAGLATLCSDAANFVDSTIHALFNMLKVAVPDSGVGAVVATIWNWIVSQGEAFVRGLISAVTDAVLATVRAIAGGIAAIASQVSALVPWVVTVTVDPSATIALGNNLIIGDFVATATAGDLPDWPDVMKDCATKAQVALPSFRARDEPVTWGQPMVDAPGLITPVSSDARTDGNGQATWRFTTGPDPGDAPGEQRNATVAIDVTIHRSALDDARKSLADALFSGIPSILRGFVDKLFGFFVDPLQGAIAALIDTHATGFAVIVYHHKPAATPTPEPSATPGDITGIWHGAWTSSTYQGLTGGFTLKFAQKGTTLSGTIVITGSRCISAGTITGSLKGDKIEFGAVEGAETVGYSGVFSGGTMSGEYHVVKASGGECTDDVGAWQAAR